MGLVWRETMSIGEVEVDADHKKLLNLINAIEKYIAEWNPVLMAEIFERVKAYSLSHFAQEEALMARAQYPHAAGHIAQHKDIIRKCQIIYNKFHEFPDTERKKGCAGILLKFLQDYFVNHVIKEDLKLKPFVDKAGGDGALKPLSSINQPLPPRKPRNQDIEYALPPELAHMLQRLEFVAPPMPAPQSGFADFSALCDAAINYRIDKVLVFFQRHNPALNRGMPPIFICSPDFAERFRQAVSHFIFPVIRSSRQIQMLSTSFDWSEIDTENFWEKLTPLLKENILANWAAAWDELKLVSVTKADGTKVQQVSPETKLLREMLQAGDSDSYLLPRVVNREIETFKSFLDTKIDWWARLNRFWEICYDIYEQEKDPRVFQQKAREGALRDNLLRAFDNLPEKWGDFVVLACYRTFPRVSLQFLESFSHNFGRNEDARAAFVPYTIYYLQQAALRPEIRLRESQEEAEWKVQAKELSDYLSGRKTVGQTGRRKSPINLADFKKTVLIVDGIDAMRKQMGQILRSAGIASTAEASEGGQAFALLTAAPDVYGLIIADLHMEPTNGMHLLTILRTDAMTPPACRDLPFIMLTGEATPQRIEEVRKAGANGVVAKPFAPTSLINAVIDVLS